jgi:L-iditol 2-dehydrogenase
MKLHQFTKRFRNMSTSDGALMEPLSVGMHAAQISEAKIGQSATILGSGPIGLVTLITLKARGVTEIYVSDLVQSRLDKALELGATAVIRADKQNVVDEIKRLTNGHGTDLVFETAGSTKTTEQTPLLVRKGGIVTLVGMPPDGTCHFNMSKLIGKEAQLRTVMRYYQH